MERWRELKNKVLQVVETGREVVLEEILNQLREYDETDVKAAIWSLLSEHEIELTSQLKIHPIPAPVKM